MYLKHNNTQFQFDKSITKKNFPIVFTGSKFYKKTLAFLPFFVNGTESMCSHVVTEREREPP